MIVKILRTRNNGKYLLKFNDKCEGRSEQENVGNSQTV